MKDDKEIICNLNCRITKEYADIIFHSIDFYRDCSIMFLENNKIAKKCNTVWLLLNENCKIIN